VRARLAAVYAAFAMSLLYGPLGHAQTNQAKAAAPFGSPLEENRVFVHGLLDELEGRFGGVDPTFRWDGEGWIGTDRNRLWVKSEGSVANGVVEGGDHELLYDRPFSTFWDLQAGVRYDIDSFASRGWAAVGIEGLAPQFFQFSATLYASDAGHFAAKLVASYEALITQRLILEPLVELNAYTKPDPARGVASGLSDLDTGLRLRYEISRKFGPYLGVVYERAYGPAAPRAGAAPNLFNTSRSGDWRFALGVRAWF
jgi:copper resistance protein B